MNERELMSDGNSRDNLFTTLGRIEGKQDAQILSHAELARRVDDTVSRLSKLENYRAWLMGAAVAAGAVSGFLFKHI